MVGRRPTIMAKIDGHEARLLIDTGGFFNTINPDEATRLGLKLEFAPASLRVRGIGGTAQDIKMATAKTFEVGPLAMKNVDFVTTATGGFGQEVVGLLGENILGAYDIEYDLGEGAIRLYGFKGDCDNVSPTYWSKSSSELKIDPTQGLSNKLVGMVSINGHQIRATFDTGAASSILNLRAAKNAGITPQSPGVRAAGVSRGIGSGEVTTWIVPLDSFAIADETISKIQMQMGAVLDGADSDMLLGVDFFLAHRVFVEPEKRRIFFTYSGGRVFSLEPRIGVVEDPAPAAGPAAGDAPVAADGAPKTGDDLARRASAFMARGEFPKAIADLNRAVELEPSVAQHYFDRARARLANREAALAMADLDEALKLRPDNAQALLTRGGLYLGMRDEPRARQDFEAALALPTADPMARVAIGTTYERSGRYEIAVGHYDRWIAEHSKDMRMDVVLNARCWARAQWNKDLDKALADCDAALKLRPRTAAYLDSRGLVRLRMGQFDQAVADYDSALAIQPRQASTLYFRAVAKQGKGDAAGATADRTAALSIDRNAATQAVSLGLPPVVSAPPSVGAAPAAAAPQVSPSK